MTEASYINRPITTSAHKGVVVAEEAGRRGAILLTIRMEDDSIRKMDLRSIEFSDEPLLGRDDRPVRSIRDYYGDVRRMSARW